MAIIYIEQEHFFKNTTSGVLFYKITMQKQKIQNTIRFMKNFYQYKSISKKNFITLKVEFFTLQKKTSKLQIDSFKK